MSLTELRKYGMGFLLIALLLFVICGCGNVAVKKEAERKTIVVGIDAYPPFSYIDENGKSSGIDAELARAAFSRMGYHAEIQRINWEKKDALLSSGEIDCIWSCFSMKGREDQYLWAGPYLMSRQVVAVNPDSDIRTLADLEGKVIAVQSTTKPEGIFAHPGGRIPVVKGIYSFFDRDIIYTYLSKGYVDAIGAHETVIVQYMKDYHTAFRILDEPLMVVGVGVAFDKNDKRGIVEALRPVIREMSRDGTTEEILSHYVDQPKSYLEGLP